MKKFNNTPNKRFTVEDSGTIREIWDSRSCAVCIILLLRRGDEYSVLLTRRGEGCPDYVGCWGNVCGYLDRDESIIDAVKRELYEETGLDFDSLVCPRSIKFLGYDDELEGAQNITLRHLVICDYDEVTDLLSRGIINGDTESRGGELNEVSGIVVVPLSNFGSHIKDWAFNHDELLSRLQSLTIHSGWLENDSLLQEAFSKNVNIGYRR